MITWTLATKSKKHRKKKAPVKAKLNGNTAKVNGITHEEVAENEDIDTEEPETPVEAGHSQAVPDENGNGSSITNGASASPSNVCQSGTEDKEGKEDTENTDISTGSPSTRSRKATQTDDPNGAQLTTATEKATTARLDALVEERTALQDEVTQLRRSLEKIQGRHDDELSSLRERLEDTQGEREHAEAQYRSLLGKVNTIKSQLGERLKADAVCSLERLWGQPSYTIIGRLITSENSH